METFVITKKNSSHMQIIYSYVTMLTLLLQNSEYSGRTQVNIMTADDVAPCVARSSAAIILNMQDKQALVLYICIYIYHDKC